MFNIYVTKHRFITRILMTSSKPGSLIFMCMDVYCIAGRSVRSFTSHGVWNIVIYVTIFYLGIPEHPKHAFLWRHQNQKALVFCVCEYIELPDEASGRLRHTAIEKCRYICSDISNWEFMNMEKVITWINGNVFAGLSAIQNQTVEQIWIT